MHALDSVSEASAAKQASELQAGLATLAQIGRNTSFRVSSTLSPKKKTGSLSPVAADGRAGERSAAFAHLAASPTIQLGVDAEAVVKSEAGMPAFSEETMLAAITGVMNRDNNVRVKFGRPDVDIPEDKGVLSRCLH